MCRLYGFLSNEPTKVDCSLVFAQNALLLQSRADEIGRHHADGWGIATYKDNGTPRLIKNTTAAFNDQTFSEEAERIYTTAAIAHVRKATVGTPSEFNTHPFRVGNWVFAHNGTVTGFSTVEELLAQETDPDLQQLRRGSTDSEQYFLWLLSQLRRGGLVDLESDQFDVAESARLKPCLAKLIGNLDQRCRNAASDLTPKLNFLLTDGKTMVACRWNNNLQMIKRHGLYECEICGIPHIHHHETVDHRAIAFASEPITNEPWEEVPNKSFVISALDVQPATTS